MTSRPDFDCEEAEKLAQGWLIDAASSSDKNYSVVGCLALWLKAAVAEIRALRAERDRIKPRMALLENVHSAAASLMSEDGAREALAHYNVLHILADELAAVEEDHESD